MKFIPTKKTKQKNFLYQYHQPSFKKIKVPLKLIMVNHKVIGLDQRQALLEALAGLVVKLVHSYQQVGQQVQ